MSSSSDNKDGLENMDNFDFDQFMATTAPLDEFHDEHDRSQQAADQAMSGMSQNAPQNPSPEPKREESPGLFIPATPDLSRRQAALPDLRSPIDFAPVQDNDLYDASPEPDRVSEPQQDNPLPTTELELVEEQAVEDDDIVMINEEDASPEAQIRWGQLRKIGIASSSSSVKQEAEASAPVNPEAPIPATQDPEYLRIMAAQHAMRQAVTKQNNAAAARLDRQTVEPEGSRRRRHSFVQIGDEHENANEAMRGELDEEDLGWMNDENQGPDEEYETLTLTRNTLERKKKSGKITPAEQLELYNVLGRIKTKDNLRMAVTAGADREDEEETLFVHEEREAVVGRHIRDRPMGSTFHDRDDWDNDGLTHMLEDMEHGGGDGPGNNKQAKGKGRGRKKGTGKRPTNAREVRQQEDAKREKEREKAQKKKAEAAKKAAPPKKAKGRPPAKKPRGAKRGGFTTRSDSLLRPQAGYNMSRQSGKDDIAHMILEDLLIHDPISTRLNDPIFNVQPEPTIHGGQQKKSQFDQLFANIPPGGNKRVIQDDKKKLKEASKSFGYAKVRAVSGKWLVKGMKSPLYHHQLLGAQWMVSRELSAEAPYGGLLADSMGLGKTVQTLACMVGNPPTPEDLARNVKATLIVVPAAVLDQWMDEIRFHAEEKVFKKIQRYKTSSQLSQAVLEDMDIVVTTYNEVMRQFPFPDKEQRQQIELHGYQRWWRSAMTQVGDLHKVNWYRIVLDEAHAIKNNSARTSLACQNLKSIYRWCLTGTPLLNRLEELFPYLRFLKAHYSMDWQTFQRYFCDPQSPDSQNRIATLLSYTMMRRTMKTTIMNRPIITLPKPHPLVQYINFSPEEQAIYRITENRFRSNINIYFQRDEVRRNYSVFMVQLLRLRQCTSHPFMLERTIKEAWTLEDVTELQRKFDQLGTRNTVPFFEQTKVWVQESEAVRQAARDRGEDVPPLLPFGRGGFGQKFDMGKAIAGLSEKELHQRVNCAICQDVPEETMETDCGHLFCKECLENYLHVQAAAGDDEFMTCPSCNQIFSEATRRELANDNGDGAEASMNRKNKSKKGADGVVSKGMDALGFEPGAESVWLWQSDNDPNFPLAPSAKTAALKATLLKGFEEAPLDKVVVYVQFRLLARIIGRLCASEHWGFLYLSGDCSLEHRGKAVKRFRDDPDIKIMIAGLKCGGLGLNFPWANRCISLDLWWNHAVEQQAFGRIFRIGQSKETHMTRIVVKNSVDMRLLTMQMHKLQDLEKAISEERKEGLSLDQLANLFGFLRKDGEGVVVGVESDYEDEGGVGEDAHLS